MSENSQNNKSITRLSIILLPLLIATGTTIFILTRPKNNPNTENQEIQETEDPEKDESETITNIPEVTFLSSTEAYVKLLESAKAWAPDAQISMLQAVTESVEQANSREFYGATAGKYNFWSANIYSASKAEISTVILKNNVMEVQAGVSIYESLTAIYEDQPYITDISAFVSSETVYTTAKAAGLDNENNIYDIYLMYDKTTEKWVFRVDEKSKTELDEYDCPFSVKYYFVDAVSGNLIEED
ncbi:hypothetical protein JW962_01955 [Candidatus Dojkabacteria bacterium]|nr:hypothetical protein [Candidatus Dojkabacteria bacterium]